MSSGRRSPDHAGGIVVEHRREPALGLRDRPALARRVVLGLVALDLADTEIMALRMRDVDTGDRGARPHGEALRQGNAGTLAHLHETPQSALLGVVRLRGVAWS